MKDSCENCIYYDQESHPKYGVHPCGNCFRDINDHFKAWPVPWQELWEE